jgi:hypothetical protein
MPSIHGEDAVLRILDKEALTDQVRGLRLDFLGFGNDAMRKVRRLCAEPYGMFLVTGPTGSGKTTTLYAALSEINHGRDKIITIEDPVEYQLPGVLQIPVNEKKGLTFARGLRSILRHDPDKIMVGEIRDPETAQIAVQAALTGHLVFTTVHANNVFDVLGRFTHMGIDPYSLVAALNGILAQRLIRLNCPHCVAPHAPTAAQLSEAGLAAQSVAAFDFRAGRGCGQCRGSGYKGRRAIAELLIFTDEIRERVAARAPIRELKDMALANGTQFCAKPPCIWCATALPHSRRSIVSPWWREQISARIAPGGITLLRNSRGPRRRVLDRQSVTTSTPDSTAWQPVVELLGAQIEARKWRNADLGVVLGGHLARYLVLPWIENLRDAMRWFCPAVVRRCARKSGRRLGDMPEPCGAGLPRIAAAADREMIEALHSQARSLRLKLRSVRPVLAAAVEDLARVDGRMTGWLAIVESGNSCVARFRGGECMTVRTARFAEPAEQHLLAQLEQDALCAGLESGTGKLYVHAALPLDDTPLQERGWKVLPLPGWCPA